MTQIFPEWADVPLVMGALRLSLQSPAECRGTLDTGLCALFFIFIIFRNFRDLTFFSFFSPSIQFFFFNWFKFIIYHMNILSQGLVLAGPRFAHISSSSFSLSFISFHLSMSLSHFFSFFLFEDQFREINQGRLNQQRENKGHSICNTENTEVGMHKMKLITNAGGLTHGGVNNVTHNRVNEIRTECHAAHGLEKGPRQNPVDEATTATHTDVNDGTQAQ